MPRWVARVGALVASCSVLVALVAGLVAAAVPVPTAAQARGDRFIVVLRDDVADPRAAAAELGRQHGLGIDRVYTTVLKGFAASVPAQALAGLRRNPRVAFVDPDLPVAIAQDVQAMRTLSTGATLPTGVDRAGAEAAGPGAAVAVLDTGIAAHPDLSIAGGYNCTGPDTSGPVQL